MKMSNFILNSKELKTAAQSLKAGDTVLLSGRVYTARDAAHQRLIDMLNSGEELPFDLDGATIYYAGPTEAPKGLAVGSCGPTTSCRMDSFTPTLLENGLCCMIGKGDRSDDVIASMIKNKAVYLCAVGGAGALAAKCIKKAKVIAFSDLGPESIKELELKDFPLIVGIDSLGNSLFIK